MAYPGLLCNEHGRSQKSQLWVGSGFTVSVNLIGRVGTAHTNNLKFLTFSLGLGLAPAWRPPWQRISRHQPTDGTRQVLSMPKIAILSLNSVSRRQSYECLLCFMTTDFMIKKYGDQGSLTSQATSLARSKQASK